MLSFRATIRKVETMSDGGLRLRVDTQELPPDSGAVLLGLRGAYGSMAFKVNEGFTEAEALEIPDVKTEFNDKTPSQRLRNVLYVMHKQKKTTEPFDSWYIAKMSEIIDHFKSQLEPEGV